jgi:hypothetical protein
MKIELPKYVFESNLTSFIESLSLAELPEDILIDFAKAKFYIPGAFVALVAVIRHWLNKKVKVSFVNHNTCEMYRYLQRMDFFRICGLNFPEHFVRHSESGRFVPIRQIGLAGLNPISQISRDVADCLAPDLKDSSDPEISGFYDFLEYAISELALNVTQHSQGQGFICAQYTPGSQLARIGICDNGIGIRKSFEVNGSPHFEPKMTDKDAILRALQPQVSSKNHIRSAWNEVVNAGVGLTILQKLTESYKGHFAICSGNSMLFGSKAQEMTANKSFPGTYCSLSFNRHQISNFFLTLNEVKDSLNLDGEQQDLGVFS